MGLWKRRFSGKNEKPHRRRCQDIGRQTERSGKSGTLPEASPKNMEIDEERNFVKKEIVARKSSIGNFSQGKNGTQPPDNSRTTQHGAPRFGDETDQQGNQGET